MQIDQLIQEFEQNFYKVKRKSFEYKLLDDKAKAKEIFSSIFEKITGEKMTYLEPYNDIIDWILSADKGLGIIGTMGTGKTITACSIIPLLFYHKYKIIPYVVKSYEIDEKNFEQITKSKIIIIDELANESPVNIYGTKYDFVPIIIDKCETENKTLIFTSNKSRNDIKERYGAPILDRILKLCKIIIINNKSFRSNY